MFLRYNIAGILWAIFIFILCSLPGYAIPHYRWTDLLSVDKAVHAFLFAVLTILLVKGFKKQTQFPFLQAQAVITVFLFSLSYGGLLELMQTYCFTERSGSWFDFLANSAGSIIGLAVIKNFKKIKI